MLLAQYSGPTILVPAIAPKTLPPLEFCRLIKRDIEQPIGSTCVLVVLKGRQYIYVRPFLDLIIDMKK